MSQTLVTMEPNGRLVIPTAVRTALGISGREMLAVEDKDGSIVLTPVVAVPVDHSFPITPDLVASAKRAEADAGHFMGRADVRQRMTQTVASRQSG